MGGISLHRDLLLRGRTQAISLLQRKNKRNISPAGVYDAAILKTRFAMLSAIITAKAPGSHPENVSSRSVVRGPRR
ncbi:MAG: hypothetical protein AUK26_05440 [Syntrophaceae bacterium CG2_30_58_14]|nr:MAG: hypothetical protein AUK26_05440 [Syntrophaceae bacterium CG2_30_58_14]